MRSFLEVINGRYAGTTHLVETGEVCTVGARFGADLFLPNDGCLAPLHFVLKNEADKCLLENISGKIFVNNKPFKKGELAHGDWISAGETLFRFTIDGAETEYETVLGKLIEYLLKIENLCLLIDENLDRRILPILLVRYLRISSCKGCGSSVARTTVAPSSLPVPIPIPTRP